MKTEKIVISIYHKFFKREILRWEFFYDREKSSNGWYSRFWKRTKLSVANELKTPAHWIRCDISFVESRNDRTILSLPNGFKLDMPKDMDDIDHEIIHLILQALKLSCEN